MAHSKYSPSETLYGGVNINQDGILTSKALFGCSEPREVELKKSIDNSVQVTVLDTFTDCKFPPSVQEFSIDLKPFLKNFRYFDSEIRVGNKIIFEYDEDGFFSRDALNFR
jgi:hypothetical protein